MEKIHVNMILELMGRPEKYLVEAMQNISTRIGAEKGVKVLSKKLNDPILVEDGKELFTSFIEVSLEIDSLPVLFGLIFTYMPSNVEVVSPETINLTNVGINEMINAITTRLHHYDAVTKQVLGEKEILLKKLYEVAPHLFKDKEEAKNNSGKVEKKQEKKEKKKSKKKK